MCNLTVDYWTTVMCYATSCLAVKPSCIKSEQVRAALARSVCPCRRQTCYNLRYNGTVQVCVVLSRLQAIDLPAWVLSTLKCKISEISFSLIIFELLGLYPSHFQMCVSFVNLVTKRKSQTYNAMKTSMLCHCVFNFFKYFNEEIHFHHVNVLLVNSLNIMMVIDWITRK